MNLTFALPSRDREPVTPDHSRVLLRELGRGGFGETCSRRQVWYSVRRSFCFFLFSLDSVASDAPDPHVFCRSVMQVDRASFLDRLLKGTYHPLSSGKKQHERYLFLLPLQVPEARSANRTPMRSSSSEPRFPSYCPRDVLYFSPRPFCSFWFLGFLARTRLQHDTLPNRD